MAAPAPTYDQVLAAPDDVELNLTYARSEIAARHLLSAAEAYERILILHPDLESVRLAYGKVLVSLDDRDDAREQFKLLDVQQLTVAEQEEAARYRRDLAGSAKQ